MIDYMPMKAFNCIQNRGRVVNDLFSKNILIAHNVNELHTSAVYICIYIYIELRIW